MITTKEMNDVASKPAMSLHGNIRAPEKRNRQYNQYFSNHQSAHPAIIKENL